MLSRYDSRPRNANRVKTYYVYILASWTRALYTGVTSDLPKRVWQHRSTAGKAFTARYRVNRLVYVESTNDPLAALAREKQIKAWSRRKRIDLVESMNPTWRDLSGE